MATEVGRHRVSRLEVNADDDENGSVVSSVVDRYGFVYADSAEEPPMDLLVRQRPHDLATLRRREQKWLDMLDHWDHYILHRSKSRKVRQRCRKGIPASVRPRAWLHLCGAKFKIDQDPLAFERLANEPGEAKWLDDIRKDLHRNFPNHELFGGAYERIGQSELFKVLKAYSVRNPVEGYCQAQAPLAATLLMSMPAGEAFWCLVCICENYIPGYYAAGMETLQLEGDVLLGLLKRAAPSVHRHLQRQAVEPVLFMTEWFLCLFTRTLPWPCVMRVWDMFLFEGVKVLFRVGLVLLKAALPKRVRKACPTMYETLEALKNLPPGIRDPDFLVEAVVGLDVTDEDMKVENVRQLARRKRAGSAPAL